jgi:hypothetical protein
MPVVASKSSTSQYVTVSLTKNTLSSITFVLKEWGSSKTFVIVELQYSTDGKTWSTVSGVGYNGSTAKALSAIGTTLTVSDLPEGVTTVRLHIKATNSKNQQIGIQTISVVAK